MQHGVAGRPRSLRSGTMIDLHCHLLPGIDDGPATMDKTVALAGRHVAAGVTCVAATPHVTWEIPTRASLVAAGVADVRARLAGEQIPLEVTTGGEVAMSCAADLSDDELSALKLGANPEGWLLLEAPLEVSAVGFERIVAHLQDRGHRILIAHPERSPTFHRSPDLLEQLISDGALTSITAAAFSGQFGAEVRQTALEFVERGLAHSVASDAHDAVRRPPGLLSHLEEAGLERFVEWWCVQVPSAILAGTALPPAPASFPPAPERPRRRRFHLR